MSQALAAEDLTCRAGGATLLDRVTLELEPGQRLVILGPNGAGKTTLLKALAGLVRPAAGQVTLDGVPLGRLAPTERARQLALVLGAQAMAFAWSTLEVVLMGRAPWVRVGGFESADDHARALRALTRVGASHLAGRAFDALSAGEQQRVLIARALAQDATYLLLDEPTSHQDPAHALALGRLTAELAAEGRAVACVLHDLGAAERFGDRIAVLQTGRLVATGAPALVLTPELVMAVYGVPSRRLEGQLLLG